MKFVLLLLAVGAAVAAGFLASARGAFDWATLTLAAVTVVALSLARLTPAREARRNLGEDVAQPSEVREELEGLSANLQWAAAARESAAAAPGDGTVTLRLVKTGRNQIAVIKALREHLHIGLTEAKALTDAAAQGNHPQIGVGMGPMSARALMQAVEDAGGRVEPE